MPGTAGAGVENCRVACMPLLTRWPMVRRACRARQEARGRRLSWAKTRVRASSADDRLTQDDEAGERVTERSPIPVAVTRATRKIACQAHPRPETTGSRVPPASSVATAAR